MAQVTAFVGNRENSFTGTTLNDEGTEQQARVTTLEQTSRQLQSAVQDEIAGAEATKPNRKRKKAKAFGLLLLAGLGACIAWYPLSDHHAPFAGGAAPPRSTA